MTSDIAIDRHHAGHDLYVTDATHALHPMVPRVLVRCCRCGRLGVGVIETDADRAYTSLMDREFDTGEWWCFDALRIIGSTAAPCPRSATAPAGGTSGNEGGDFRVDTHRADATLGDGAR